MVNIGVCGLYSIGVRIVNGGTDSGNMYTIYSCSYNVKLRGVLCCYMLYTICIYIYTYIYIYIYTNFDGQNF